MTHLRSALALPIVLACSTVPALGQSTWHVDLTAPPPGDGSEGAPYVSIQQAIDAPATVAGDTILVAPGWYHESIHYAGKRLHLRSVAGPLETVLSPADASDADVVRVQGTGEAHPRTSLEGFTIRRDASWFPQTGIWCNAPLQLRRCIVTGHDRGIFQDFNAAELELWNCTITRNSTGIDRNWDVFLTNTICKGNPALDVEFTIFGSLYLRYSLVGDADDLCTCCAEVVCEDAFDGSPSFWNPLSDFHLRGDSPCIDAGDPDGPPDPDGSPADVGALVYDPFHAPGTQGSCYGDALLCPCGNGGSGAGGCDNAAGTGGVRLEPMDFLPEAGGGTVRLLASGFPAMGSTSTVLVRGPALTPAPVPFGDGLRCVALQGIRRLVTAASSGASLVYELVHDAGAGAFHYQTWYRSNPPDYCDPTAGHNMSNALTISW